MRRVLERYKIELLLFSILLACYGYFLPRWADWNQNSRLDLVLAIVDDGTLAIDRYVANTGDYAKFNGHYYSDKAPGLSFLAVPVYMAARPVLQAGPVRQVIERLADSAAFNQTVSEAGTGLLREKIYLALVLTLVTFVTVAAPGALLGVLLFRFLAIFGIRAGLRAVLALVYGLATPAFPYAGAFYAHQLVAALLFGAFFLAFLIGQRRISQRWSPLVGFLLGYALISEYPAALIVAAVGLYLLAVLPDRRWVVGAAAAGVPPLALMMAYNYAIFGTLLPVGYKYSELWQAEHQIGFMSLSGLSAEALWGVTFGQMRGLFFIAPVLLLAAVGLVVWLRGGKQRLELAVCAWSAASFLVFNGSSAMWFGGFAVGPRYVVPMLPFLAMGLGAFAAHWGGRWWARVLAVPLGAWSLAAVWAETIGGQSFPQFQPRPLIDYSMPALAAGDIARNLGMALDLTGWASLLPLAGAMGVGLFLLATLAAPQPDEGAPARRVVRGAEALRH
ncbi:MAG TPA: hypothetical protein VNL77_06515 [Roseiflexaceae bacterium]|nr:hypothetical protein [Roseiflexaceae bacterium]